MVKLRKSIAAKTRRLWQPQKGKAVQRLLVMALSLCMIFTLIPTVGFAAEKVTSGSVLPPDGYTADANGFMAFKNSSNIIDVKGFYKDNWIQTTYSNRGYEIQKANIPDDSITAKADFVNDGRYVQLSYTVTAKDSAITNGKLAVHADVQIGNNDGAAVEVIQDADGKVIGLKMVDDDENNSTHDAQFNLYFADAGGVTPVDTYWFGYYNNRSEHCFHQLTDETKSSATYSKDGDIFTKLSGTDSGMAFSWQNINVDPGKSKTYSVILGVGEKSEPPAWETEGDTSPISLTLAADRQELSVNVGAKITHVDGVTASLYYDINGGEGIKLGEFEQGTDMDSVSVVLDISKLVAGSHDLHFWVVNDKGATSSAVTKTIIINEEGKISGGLDGDIPPAVETAQEKLDQLFGQGNATFENNKIVINKNIELDNTVEIDVNLTGKKDVVIDLNDKCITVKPGTGDGKDAIAAGSGVEVTVTGGGTITGGNGTGNGAGGDAVSGNGSVIVADRATLIGGDGAGNGTGGSGAAMSGNGSVTVSDSGKVVGGNGTAAGAAGGTGAKVESGAINVEAGGAVIGGNGGDGDQTTAGGVGGTGTSTNNGSTTVKGTVTGGNGGNGTDNQNGGNGGVGANQTGTINGNGIIRGGNGGNLSGSGSGKPGTGGAAISEGSSFDGTTKAGFGGINAKVESQTGAPVVTVPEETLINAAVTERERLDSSIIKIDVTLSVEKETNPADKGKVDAKIAANQKIGVYLSIELKKTITKNAGSPTTASVTDAEEPITITVIIPENMRNGSNYKIIRVHGNDAEIIEPTYDSSAHTLTFATDKFSTYAIAYEPKNTPDTPTYVPPYRPGEKDSVTSDEGKTTLHQSSTIKDGVESITISDGDADKLIAAIEKNQSDEVLIDVQPMGTASAADTAKIVLPVKVAGAIIETGTDQLTYQIGDFIITFDKKAIKAIKEQAKGETIVLSAKKDFDGISGVKVTNKSGEAFVVTIKMTSSDAAINYFDGGKAKVSVKTKSEATAKYVYASGKTAEIDSELKDGWLGYTTDRFDNIPYWGAKVRAGVQKTRIVGLKSKAKKGSITLTWKKSRSVYKLDGYQVWRSVKKNSKFKLMKTTKSQAYKNTKALKKGVRYYYKVRGCRKIDGKTIYTRWSEKIYRIAK